MKKIIIYICGCAFFSLWHVQSYAQSTLNNSQVPAGLSSIEFIDKNYEASERTIKLVLDKLRPILPDYAKPHANFDNFAIVALQDYGAYQQTDTKKVMIPLGLIVENRYMIQAFQEIEIDPNLKPQFGTYVKYLADRAQSVQKNGKDIPIRNFYSWINRSTSIPNSEKKRAHDFEVAALVDMTAFIVAHELAHLVLEHKPATKLTPKDSYEQEFDADLRARIWLEKAGFKVVPAALLLVRMMASQISSNGDPLHSKTHPHPGCRLYTTFLPVLSRQRSDPEIIEGARRAGFPSVSVWLGNMLVLKELCIQPNFK